MDGEVAHARTAGGFDLPVIDFTDPRFSVSEEPAAVEALRMAFEVEERRRRRLPAFLLRLMLRSAMKKSRLLNALFGRDADYLDSISTYVLKLGADNLPPPYDSPLDRRVASSPHVVSIRLRMQQTATLLAQALSQALQAGGGEAVHLINIGGGPALDSVNALSLLRKAHPELTARTFAIHVLDADPEGPAFGVNALTALKAPGRALEGLDITFRSHAYDWNDTRLLEEMVRDLARPGSVLVASSEGALFEYGSDEAIIANLRVLNAGGRGALAVAGSVTRDDRARRAMIANTRFRLVPRGIGGFGPVAACAGYGIDKVAPGLLSDQVLLTPQARLAGDARGF